MIYKSLIYKYRKNHSRAPPFARMRGNFFEGGGLDYGTKKAILE